MPRCSLLGSSSDGEGKRHLSDNAGLGLFQVDLVSLQLVMAKVPGKVASFGRFLTFTGLVLLLLSAYHRGECKWPVHKVSQTIYRYLTSDLSGRSTGEGASSYTI